MSQSSSGANANNDKNVKYCRHFLFKEKLLKKYQNLLGADGQRFQHLDSVRDVSFLQIDLSSDQPLLQIAENEKN